MNKPKPKTLDDHLWDARRVREIIDDRLWRIHQHASALRAIGEIALGNGSNQNDSLSNLNPDHFLHLMELLASGLEGAKNDLEHALNQPALRAA